MPHSNQRPSVTLGDPRGTSFRSEIDSTENSPNRRSRQAEMRRQRQVRRLHSLGPQPLLYFIRDIERGADIDATLAAYARLPSEFIAALGGDQFAPALHVVDGGRS